MPTTGYRYTFQPEVPLGDVQETLIMAILAGEALHGSAQLRLDATYHFDPDLRSCVIDATTAVGLHLNRLFVGFLRREFGEASFTVERIADRVIAQVTVP
jgi:hypothetical protein